MSGKVIETDQIRVYMNARDLGLTQADAASLAEFSERSGQRLEAGDYQLNRGRVRDWRTCADPLYQFLKYLLQMVLSEWHASSQAKQ